MPGVTGADYCSAAGEVILATNEQKEAYFEETSHLKMEEIDEKILKQIFARYKGEPGFVIVTWEEFRDLVKKAYPLLIDTAKKEKFVTYGEVGGKIGLYVGSGYFQLKIGFVVGACSNYETIKGQPLISAIVVNDTTRYPGQGFWVLPQIRDHIHLNNLNIQYSDTESGYEMTDEMLHFWTSEVRRVFDWWKAHDC